MQETAREAVGRTNEKAYEKFAWIIFLVIGLFFLVASGIVRALVAGPEEDDVKAGALSAIFWAIFVVTVAAFPYKRGEKWSWYLLSSLPVQFVIFGAFFFLFSSDAGHTAIIAFYSFWAILSLLGLFLPYRKFFPKASATL